MLSRGPITFLTNKHFDLGLIHDSYQVSFCSRKNFPSLTIFNIIKVFSLNVWLGLLICQLGLAFMFVLIYKMYLTIPQKKVELGPLHSYVDILIRIFASITEPDSLKWFPGYTIGRFLVMLWIIFSTFMIFFYNCNLRAFLIASDSEPNLNTVHDVLEKGGKLYLLDIASRIQYGLCRHLFLILI